MKKHTIGLTLLLAAIFVAAAPVHAASGGGPKTRLFAKYDTNQNGVIDGTEIEGLRKAYAADPKGDLARYDRNKDGKLSDEEIAEIKPPGGKKAGGKKKYADQKTDSDAKPAKE